MRFVTRIGLPLAALVVALSVTASFAGSTHENLARAPLTSSSSGIDGEAFVRRIANGKSHLALRLTGLVPNSLPVWRLYSNDMCMTVGTLVTEGTFPTVAPNGATLAVVPEVTGIAVGDPNPNFYALRVFSSNTGPQLVCGRLVDLPDELGGSQHWW
jgi:hypothetical protein